jgi:prepilin-type N-terminal cleavage/methylation domain-containing protein
MQLVPFVLYNNEDKVLVMNNTKNKTAAGLVSHQRERGFTLIELLIVIAIVGLLAAISGSMFVYYRQNAAFSVVQRLGEDIKQDVEVASTSLDSDLPAFDVNNPQTADGPIADASARQVLTAVQIPRDTTFMGRFDPSCVDAGCESAFVELHHVKSEKYLQLFRAGDGVWAPIEVTN